MAILNSGSGGRMLLGDKKVSLQDWNVSIKCPIQDITCGPHPEPPIEQMTLAVNFLTDQISDLFKNVIMIDLYD